MNKIFLIAFNPINGSISSQSAWDWDSHLSHRSILKSVQVQRWYSRPQLKKGVRHLVFHFRHPHRRLPQRQQGRKRKRDPKWIVRLRQWHSSSGPKRQQEGIVQETRPPPYRNPADEGKFGLISDDAATSAETPDNDKVNGAEREHLLPGRSSRCPACPRHWRSGRRRSPALRSKFTSPRLSAA